MYLVTLTGPSGSTKTFTSIVAASRVLSGNGTDSKRRTLTRRLEEGGGYVGNVWAQYA